jgi:hypothetical protein
MTIKARLLMATVALMMLTGAAHAASRVAPQRWCPVVAEWTQDWFVYERCADKPVKGPGSVLMYQNGDFTEDGEDCRVVRQLDDGWTEYRCTFRGKRTNRREQFASGDTLLLRARLHAQT